MNLKALAGNRRVQLAAGGVAVAGVAGFALWRRHQAGGEAASSAADASSSGTPAAYVPGSFPDTSGTDMAGYLGQFGSNLQTQLDDFLSALQDAQAGQTIPTSGSTGTGTTAPTGPHTLPAVAPAPAKSGSPTPVRTVTVSKYTTNNAPWNSTLSGIAGHEGTTVKALQKLNGITGTTIYPGQKIKIPG